MDYISDAGLDHGRGFQNQTSRSSAIGNINSGYHVQGKNPGHCWDPTRPANMVRNRYRAPRTHA